MVEVDLWPTDGGRHCSIFSAGTLRPSDGLSAMRFLAIIITGLALVAPAAHAFALLNKIGMAKADYFIAQQAYAGWWIVGLLLPLALLANIGNAVALRADGTA